MTKHKIKISIVIPIFNEARNLSEFLNRTNVAIQEIVDKFEFEFIFSVDPSSDGSEQMLRDLSQDDHRIKMIRFTRRFGQPIATLAGIEHASGSAVIVMDVDLQDPPELIPEMLNAWENGSKLVLAERRTRVGEPATKKFISNLGYKFLNRFSEVPIPKNTGDFRLMDRKIVDHLAKFPEYNGFLRGLVSLVGFEPKIIYFDRVERYAGTTKYNKWVGSLRIAFNGVIGYSTALLKISTLIGIIFSIGAVIGGLSYGVAKVLGVDFPTGNPTLVVSIYLLGGLILLSIGILGLYIGRIYEEVKGRPRYIVDEYLGF
jgi:glycosyltransferase involved in cell wall biosynthesis